MIFPPPNWKKILKALAHRGGNGVLNEFFLADLVPKIPKMPMGIFGKFWVQKNFFGAKIIYLLAC